MINIDENIPPEHSLEICLESGAIVHYNGDGSLVNMNFTKEGMHYEITDMIYASIELDLEARVLRILR